MTSPAPQHKVIILFNGLLKRAQEGKNCLSLQSMALAYDFDDTVQAQNALDRLVQSGHIRVDIGGKYPALRIVKDHYKALHECRAKVLSPAKIEPGQTKPLPATPITTTPMPRRDVVRPNRDPSFVPPPKLSASTNIDIIGKIAGPIVLTEVELKPATDTTKQVNFRVSAADYEWLQDELSKTDEPMSMSSLVKDIMEAEILRRKSDQSGKHRLSAAVLRAARDAGQPFDQFITDLIELGLRARQAEGARA